MQKEEILRYKRINPENILIGDFVKISPKNVWAMITDIKTAEECEISNSIKYNKYLDLNWQKEYWKTKLGIEIEAPKFIIRIVYFEGTDIPYAFPNTTIVDHIENPLSRKMKKIHEEEIYRQMGL